MKRFFLYLKNYLKQSDSLLLCLCLISSIYGLVLISSAIRPTGSTSSLYVQAGAIVVGLIGYYLFSILDVDIIASRWKLLTVLGLLLILSLRWLGVEQSGNKAWIRFAGIGIQPAELVKPIFIVTMARIIVRFKEQQSFDHPLAILALLILFMAYFVLIIFVSGDIGSSLVYLFIFILMMYMAGLKWYWILAGLTSIVVAAPYVWDRLSERHQQRILAPYVPSIDPTGRDILWQTNLSKAALASGHIFGTGLYKGEVIQSGNLPFQRTDFIFSVAGEELGMAGCAVIMLLLVAIIVRCVQIGMRSESRLGSLICIGCAAMLAFQTFENIGMCIGVAPVIGLTLPFFSYGGSSIVTTYIAMGMVSSVKMKPRPGMFGRW